MRILVTGASGLLGHTLVPILRAANLDVITHGNSMTQDVVGDLTQTDITQAIVAKIKPDVAINLVALTNVDGCEDNPDEAYRLNVKVVENLVEGLAEKPDSHFVQISTDHVYDGQGPHREDNVRIINTYALSKYAGELAALRMPSTVLRINFFGHSKLEGRPSFSDWLQGKLQHNEPFTGFDDVLFNPLGMDTFSAMMLKVLEQRRCGVYNLGAHGGMSKADFAACLAAHLGLDISCMTRGSAATVSLRAARPMDMRTDCRRFESDFCVELPTLEEEIKSLGAVL